MERSTNQARLPYAIVAVNATEDRIDEQDWDCDHATRNLMSTVGTLLDSDVHYRKLAEKWRTHGKRISTMQDLLHCYYSSVRVVKIPRKEQAMLVDRQVDQLYEEITKACEYSHRPKWESQQLLNVNDFQQYMDFAYDHFSRNIDEAFDFMDAGIKRNPIPRGWKGNILKLLIHASRLDNFVGRPNEIFQHLSVIVGSATVLNCIRQRRPGKSFPFSSIRITNINRSIFGVVQDALFRLLH